LAPEQPWHQSYIGNAHEIAGELAERHAVTPFSDAPAIRARIEPCEQPWISHHRDVRDSPGVSSTGSKASKRMRFSPAAWVR